MDKVDKIKHLSDPTLSHLIEQYEEDLKELARKMRPLQDTLFELKKEREIRQSVHRISYGE